MEALFRGGLRAIAPGIEDRNAGRSDVGRVPGDEGQAVLKGRRGELRIDGGQRVPPLPDCGLELAPALADVLIEREQPAGGPHAELAIEPALQRRAPRCVAVEQADAFRELADLDD